MAYTDSDAPTVITATLTVSDVDSTTLSSATVQITGNYQEGQDLLAFDDTVEIEGTWTAATGTLVLTAKIGETPTLAEFQAALRSVTYENLSDDPSVLGRTVTFTVNDGTSDSNSVTREITVNAVD
ncbi:hypothetical protein RZS08_29835, partial [Arthrospira platensis SPKY1]|nr:hypothetical protein [Arthrospira platensis SPKY1]